jgi:hypothetical protein
MFESCRTLELSKDWAQIPVGQKPLESISSTQGSRGSGTESAASISINSNAPSAASGLRRQKARNIGHVSQFNLQLAFFLQLFATFAFDVRWRFPARSTSFAVILLAVLVSITATPPPQVTANILRRTLLIRVASATGTAFTIEVDGRQYLITAKHVVSGLPDGANRTIDILKKKGRSALRVTVFKCAEPVDIAVFIPPEQIPVNDPLDPTSTGIAVGQDAYFVGFPYGLHFVKTYSKPSRRFRFRQESHGGTARHHARPSLAA